MASKHCTSAAFLQPFVQQALQLPSLFILSRSTFPSTRAHFSTTSSKCAPKKDGNKRRGESALHGKFPVRLRRYGRPTKFPQPVLDQTKRTKFVTDENHGLWGFFDAKRSPLLTPEALDSHGRSWTVPELRKKDFEDLWKLYWTCAKEINSVATYEKERDRLKIGYGQSEAEERIQQVAFTMKAIKHTLTERWYQFETAREEAMKDPEINLYADATKGESAYIQTESQYEQQSSKT